MKILFVKTHLAFPRSSGHDVHCFHMMQALVELGCEVHLATKSLASTEAVRGANLAGIHALEGEIGAPLQTPPLTKLQSRFCSYWGIDKNHIAKVGALAKQLNCDAVVVVGLEVLPYLAAVNNAKRVWYAADEWLYHHFSQVFATRPSSWHNCKAGLTKGLYEYAFTKTTDRVWLVSKADAIATKLVMPNMATDIVPNGVDAKHFDTSRSHQLENSCTIWGRLDFGPNLDAIRWFAENVWSNLVKTVPNAKFDVFGFNPTEEIQLLSEQYSFQVIPNLPDLRQEVKKRKVVVMPFVSGGGIKNKFLEAASMGMPIVASPKALNGIDRPFNDAWLTAKTPKQWVNAITHLWTYSAETERIGANARQWVEQTCTWSQTASIALHGLEKPN